MIGFGQVRHRSKWHQRSVVIQKEDSPAISFERGNDMVGHSGAEFLDAHLTLGFLDLLQVVDKILRPAANVIALELILHAPHSIYFFLIRHGKSFFKRFYYNANIIGIDDERFMELVPGASHLAQNKHT